MAPRGQRPKPPGQARNRNPLVHPWIDVEQTPFTDGPDLPARRVNGPEWPDGIQAKWAAWSSMPHCCLWGPSDWSFAFDTLEVAAQFYHGGPLGLAGELRAREKVMGTTWDARQGMRIRYTDPGVGGDAPASVSRLEDYRDL